MYPKNPARELTQCLESDHWADSKNEDKTDLGKVNGSPRDPSLNRITGLLEPPDFVKLGHENVPKAYRAQTGS